MSFGPCCSPTALLHLDRAPFSLLTVAEPLELTSPSCAVILCKPKMIP
jgi:hypothetical protein